MHSKNIDSDLVVEVLIRPTTSSLVSSTSNEISESSRQDSNHRPNRETSSKSNWTASGQAGSPDGL